MTLMEVSEMLSPTQAAQVLRVSSETVRKMGDSGRLPVVRSPLGRLFNRRDVEDLARKRGGGDA